MISRVKILFVLSFMLSTPMIGLGQEEQSTDGWSFKIGPDIYSPFLSGEIAIDSLSGSINRSLQYAGALNFAAYTPKWSISSELMFVSVNSDLTLPVSSRMAKLDGNFSFISLSGMRRMIHWFDIGLGARTMIVNADFFVEGVQQKDSQYAAAAPLVTFRFYIYEKKKWNIRLNGDFGGFGISDTWTYKANLYIGYRFNKTFELFTGFRLLSFSSYNEATFTEMDVLMYGPKLALYFHW